MGDFQSLIPVFAPYLDSQCCALLMMLCRSIRQDHEQHLCLTLHPTIRSLIGRCVSLLTGLSPEGGHIESEPLIRVFVPPGFFYHVLLGIQFDMLERGIELGIHLAKIFATDIMWAVYPRIARHYGKNPTSLV